MNTEVISIKIPEILAEYMIHELIFQVNKI